MASLNKVQLIGRLGRDPEIRYMQSGEAVANASVAITEKWKDKNTGEKKEVTEWVRLTFYRKLAEIVGQYLKKGSEIYVEGKLTTKKWTDKEGVEKYITEVVCDGMQMLGIGPRQDDEPQQQRPQSKQQPPRPQPKQQHQAMPDFNDMDDQIPF